MKLLKRVSFFLLGIMLLVLIVATVLEKIYGTDFVSGHIYGKMPFVALWGLFSVCSAVYLWKRKCQKNFVTMLLHFSFLLILTGAFVTWMYGEQGMLHVRKDGSTAMFTDNEGKSKIIPFYVRLDDFRVVYYTGTRAPMNFVSSITLLDDRKDELTGGEVSMNRIFSYRGYRFYQSGYDPDEKGVTLAVSHDPYGIAVTYIGYILLLLSVLLFFFNRHSRFYQLIKNPLLKEGVTICLLFCCFSVVQAADNSALQTSGRLAPALGKTEKFIVKVQLETLGKESAEMQTVMQTAVLAEAQVSMPKKSVGKPNVLPREIAAHFGDLYVLYDDRICPLQTLAKDFTMKLYGTSSYKGLTPEQVFTGWIFYYSSWKEQPVIRIKSKVAQQLLGISQKYASLDDFYDRYNEYKLDEAIQKLHLGIKMKGGKGVEEADEKYNLLVTLYSGKLLKIYPHYSEEHLFWYSQGDNLAEDIADDEWFFVKKSFDYIHEMVIKKDYEGLSDMLAKLKVYQQKKAGEALPSDSRFKAEKNYNNLHYTKYLAMLCLLIGFLSFLYYCNRLINKSKVNFWMKTGQNLLIAFVFLYLTLVIGLRWYISNHVPLSNGFETMQFMAWFSISLSFLLRRKFLMSVPFGFLLCGLTLLVAMLGESNPRVTQLMPVLSSPLLSIHVAVIMVSYSLFAFMMLNGLTAVILSLMKKNNTVQIERLHLLSQIILYPAVFLLAIGIFIGAVWANISWGRYWGWDPKEVWALITFLLYSLALHPASLPWFRKPMFFHLFTIVAFFSVLITYFGVNFFLGGMHSYA